MRFLLVLLLVWLCASVGHAQFLIDRDSESWGYPPGGVKLTEPLIATMGQRQRFNPAVVAERRGLTHVQLYIDFPSSVIVEPSRAWRRQSATRYVADLGMINPGTFVNAFEALHFTAVAAGTLRLAYRISAYNRQPKHGVVRISVR